MSAPTCPGCGAAEGAYHDPGCPFRPMGATLCSCHAPVWTPDAPVEHRWDCSAGWGARGDWPRRLDFDSPSPWIGVEWAA